MIKNRDKIILQDLARQYMELCGQGFVQERRELWRRHNSLKKTRIPIYVRAFAWDEMAEARCQCEDAFYHPVETFLKQSLFRARFEDDFIFEPWLTVPAVYVTPTQEAWGGIWGMPVKWVGEGRGAKRWDPPLKEPEDVKKLVEPHHRIDEDKTREKVEKIADAVGAVMPVCVDRASLYRMWNGDISTQLCQMRGIEEIMLDMMDRPEWLHGLLGFMRDGILRTHEEAEAAGDWKLCNHENQAMAYAEEVDDPSLSGEAVSRDKLWYFCASQEYTLIGPEMFNEFMLQYQVPIIEKFGLAAYGCCEDLTHKIKYLKQIPNLRRIAVSPFADVAKCAEQIGGDYVLSYRPSPADMVAYGFDEERIRGILRRDMQACRGCCVDITLKDVETVQGDRERIRRWVQVCRDVIESVD